MEYSLQGYFTFIASRWCGKSLISIQAVFTVVQFVTLAALVFCNYSATSCEELKELLQ